MTQPSDNGQEINDLGVKVGVQIPGQRLERCEG